MKQTFNYRRARLRVVLVLAMAGMGLCGYAQSGQTDDGSAWPALRALGRDIPAHRGQVEPYTQTPFAESPHEPEGALTLRQALELALRHNPELAAAAHGVRAAEGNVRQAGALPNPDMEVTAEDVGGSSQPAAAQTTMRLSQTVELGGKRNKRREMARSEARLSGWDYEAKRLDILTQTKKGFVDVLSAQEQLALAESVLILAEDVRKVASERVKAGKVPPLEETKAGVEVSLARITRDGVKRDLDTARKLLAATWGHTTPVFTEAAGALESATDIPSLDRLSALLGQAPEVARWENQVLMSRQVLAQAKAERIPNFEIGAGIRQYEENGVAAGIAGLSLPLPLFNRNAGAIAAAAHQANRVVYEQRAARLRAEAQLVEAYGRLETARAEALTIKTELLPSAQQAFEAVQTGYREGKFGYLEVLDTQRTFYEAKTNYLEVLAAYQKAAADVERLTGIPLNTIQ
ncbi:MAG: TolC family protein [Lentisphaerae bacterium]|nr:TolC family protein [Lentisphaerota bacterium]